MTDGPADRSRLVVGVTGHRDDHLRRGDPAAVAADVAAVLEAVTASHAGRGFRLVSSLASGADSIAAAAALARGWRLQVVLPAPRAVYARDFDADGRRTLAAQLAAADAVFELPCAAERADAAHYERAGHVMLDQCDLLLAIWDGLPGRGRGGTAHTVEAAVTRGVPVVHVGTDGGPPSILWFGFDPLGLRDARAGATTRADLAALTLLAERGAGAPAPAAAARARRGRGGPLALAYPLFLALVGVRRLGWADLRPPRPAATGPAATAPLPPAARFAARLAALLEPRFAAADAEATATAQLYRGGFILNAVLSALAVALALAGLVLPARLHPLASLAEVAVLFLILGITRAGGRDRWHRRWIEQRHLAERLRGLMIAARLGDLSATADGHATPADRLLRDLARAVGLPSLAADAAYLADVRAALLAMVDDQVAYQAASAARMRLLDHRLHRLGTALFALGAAICLSVPLAGLVVGHHGPAAARLQLGAIMASALLPAIGAAIAGIRTQGDFATVGARAGTLARSLAELRAGLDAVVDAGPERSFDQLRHAVRRAVLLMNAELAEWHAAHSARPLTLPG